MDFALHKFVYHTLSLYIQLGLFLCRRTKKARKKKRKKKKEKEKKRRKKREKKRASK